MLDFLFVPTVLFLTVVAPIWIVMHYRSANRAQRGLNDEDRQTIEEMLEAVDKLTERIEALESILDDTQPKWREVRARTAQQ
ncbi:envelope stress response membrane protein PspB [Exilibacterium tricleocarpae]|uniref:Envelope stress response membrane protein PspB n=1 Tax=Exilibacterium tricleocarpae TaxID=2591008 RepID=A0A545SSN3_9GAMM|nr:envelope stress response membrane protein PspB [Exilibacterium tricleocarpae]TQV67972.1 envelope stress response membrane protein PspB [Exilibacterium tricleocarpae]